MRIQITKPITFNEGTIYELNYDVGDIIVSDEPYHELNDDGSFTICQGMSMYLTLHKDYFNILHD